MEFADLSVLTELARRPEALEHTIQYLAYNLPFVKRGDSVVILFPDTNDGEIGYLLGEAVRRREATPVFLEEDRRWKTLLWQCFNTRATTVIGWPLALLGLAKLARAQKIPLNVFHAVIAGKPSTRWMVEGIAKGFDCTVSGCFDLVAGPVVCGFSCPHRLGVHIRQDAFDVEILDDGGKLLPDGVLGNIVICPKNESENKFWHGDLARMNRGICSCGNPAPLLTDLQYGAHMDKELAEIAYQMYSWTSVLDCKLLRGEYGVELELVVFPGEKLPKLPSCARLVVRPWDPETDEPFIFRPKR